MSRSPCRSSRCADSEPFIRRLRRAASQPPTAMPLRAGTASLGASSLLGARHDRRRKTDDMGVSVEIDGASTPVVPGQQAARGIWLRNTGAIVDQFELDVVGE